MELKGGHSYITRHFAVDSLAAKKFDAIDQLWVDGVDITIKETRELISQASQQPFGAARLIVILHADHLSEQIQNTLLKLLEEPPSFLTVVLQVHHSEGLLSTIRSRLHELSSDGIQTAEVALPEGVFVDKNSTKQTFERCKDRSAILELFKAGLATWSKKLVEEPTTECADMVQLLDTAITRLQQNANQKLVIDSFLLNWRRN